MMAMFAIGPGFDQQKMHGFARLMRHSSTTNERFYSMWQQRALSNQSIDVFATMMRLDFDSVTLPPVAYQPVHLLAPPAMLVAAFLTGLQTNMRQENVRPCYGTRSIGTQTGTQEIQAATEDYMHEVDVAETSPACPTCGQFVLEVHGPFGSVRRKKYFGRYYLACVVCHRTEEGRFSLQKCLWFPLGHTPVQKSKSNQPRNFVDIQKYIAAQRHPTTTDC
jgi:hypothetical protein